MTKVISSRHRGRREELPLILGARHGELQQEVLDDPPENILAGLAQRLVVEYLQQLPQQVIAQPRVVFGKDALELGWVILLDGRHGVVDRLAQVLVAGQAEEIVKLGFWPEVEGCLLGEVILRQRKANTGARRQRRLDLGFDGLVAAVSVAQEDDAQDGHHVLAGVQVGVGAQQIGRAPESFLQLFDVVHAMVNQAFH